MGLVALVPYVAVAAFAFILAGNFRHGWASLVALKVLLVVLVMRLGGSAERCL